MNRFLKISLFTSVVLSLGACTGPRECVGFQEEIPAAIQPVIHLTDDSPVLYQAGFEVLKYKFSGLIAFRRISRDEEIRIALLSEVGLKLMEFSYADQEMKNTYCSPVITKKSIPKFIGSFLEMLIQDPQCKSVCICAEDEECNYFCKTGSEKVLIKTGDSGRTNMQLHKSRNKNVWSIYITSAIIPDEIGVRMKFRTTILLKKITNAFK